MTQAVVAVVAVVLSVVLVALGVIALGFPELLPPVLRQDAKPKVRRWKKTHRANKHVASSKKGQRRSRRTKLRELEDQIVDKSGSELFLEKRKLRQETSEWSFGGLSFARTTTGAQGVDEEGASSDSDYADSLVELSDQEGEPEAEFSGLFSRTKSGKSGKSGGDKSGKSKGRRVPLMGLGASFTKNNGSEMRQRRSDAGGSDRALMAKNRMAGAFRNMTAMVAAAPAIGVLAAENLQQLGKKGTSNVRAARRKLTTLMSDEELSDDGGGELEASSGDEDAVVRESVVRRRKPSEPARGQRFSSGMIKTHPMLVSNLKPSVDLTTCVAFSPNGQYIATAGGNQENYVRLVVRKSLGLEDDLIRFQTALLPVEDWVSSISFSRDGFYLLVGTGDTGHVVVYRMSRRPSAKPQVEAVFQTNHYGPIRSVYMTTAPGSESYFVATAGSEDDRMIKFWTFGKTPKLAYKCELRELDELDHVRFSSTGKVMAVVGPSANSGRHKTLFFHVQYSNRGAFKKVWTISKVERANIKATELTGTIDIDFGQRTNVLVALQDDTWKVVKVKETYLLSVAEFQDHEASGAPFLAAGIAEFQRCIVASKGPDLFFYRIPEDLTEPPELYQIVRDALDSDIVRVIVSPEEDVVVCVGANSRHARVFHLEEQ